MVSCADFIEIYRDLTLRELTTLRELEHFPSSSVQVPVTRTGRNFGKIWDTSSDLNTETMASQGAWWEAELPAPDRRTALPHAKLKLPSAQETWNIVKHMVTPYYTTHKTICTGKER